MTVGQPETNLDTWGLRYVKKKEVENKSPAETKPDQFMRDDEAATSNPKTRQQDKVPDTTGRYSARQSHQTEGITSHGRKIGEQVHQHQQDKTRLGGQQGETFATSGSKRGEGATDTPTRAGQALDDKGQVKHEQTHTGSEGRNLGDPSTDPKSRGGHKIKPAKQGEGSSKTPKGTMIQRASLDLAIIKCKLLKMNNVNKILPLLAAGALGAGAAGLAGGVKDAVEGDDEVEKGIYEKGTTYEVEEARAKESNKKEAEEQSPKADDGSPQGAKVSDKEIKDKKLDHVYRSEDIVEKAIELINEAYDEMKKSNPVIVSDPKGKPFCSNCGRDHGKEDAKALEGTDDQQQRMVSGTRGGNKPSCPSCGHRPNKKAEGADGGTSTTSSEGGFNHVYSDVHEKKKQEDDEDNKERNRRSEDEDSKEDWAKHN